MADPVIIACPVDIWTKIATDVTTGQVHTLDKGPKVYLHTYRDTGGAAPTSQSEGVKISESSIPIEAVSGIDVYIMPLRVSGSVRVDL